jgi:hypothetical protein
MFCVPPEIWEMQHTSPGASKRLCHKKVVCPMGPIHSAFFAFVPTMCLVLLKKSVEKTPSLKDSSSPLPVA